MKFVAKSKEYPDDVKRLELYVSISTSLRVSPSYI